MSEGTQTIVQGVHHFNGKFLNATILFVYRLCLFRVEMSLREMREREQSEIHFLAFAPPDNEDLDPVDEMNDLQDGVLGYEIEEERSLDNEI